MAATRQATGHSKPRILEKVEEAVSNKKSTTKTKANTSKPRAKKVASGRVSKPAAASTTGAAAKKVAKKAAAAVTGSTAASKKASSSKTATPAKKAATPKKVATPKKTATPASANKKKTTASAEKKKKAPTAAKTGAGVTKPAAKKSSTPKTKTTTVSKTTTTAAAADDEDKFDVGTALAAKPEEELAEPHHEPTLMDKIGGALLKVEGALMGKPGKKAAGTAKMRGTDGPKPAAGSKKKA